MGTLLCRVPDTERPEFSLGPASLTPDQQLAATSGPRGTGRNVPCLRRASDGPDGLEWKGERLVDPRATESAEERAGAVLDLLSRLAAVR